MPEEVSQAEMTPEETAPAIEEIVTAEVPQDLAEIEAEPGVNALGESVTEESYLDYEAIASEAIERAILEDLLERYETTAEESTLSQEDIFQLDSELTEIRAVKAPAANVPYVMPEAEAYKIILDGVEYFAWFPDGNELVVTDEGRLYNPSASNITGIISTTADGVSFNSYNDTVTVAPLLTASGNNNAYRYGSRIYITDYYVTGSQLYNTVSYVTNAEVVKKPGAGYGFSRYQIISLAILLVMLFLLMIRWGRKL